jgi:hypothetical protein
MSGARIIFLNPNSAKLKFLTPSHPIDVAHAAVGSGFFDENEAQSLIERTGRRIGFQN